MPTGCDNTLTEPGSNGNGLQWFVDPSSSNEARCDQRENDFSGFCGRTDTLTHYGNEAPTIPIDVEFKVSGETEESFTEDKQTAFINTIATELGINANHVTITIGVKANPVARRLSDDDLLVTVTIALEPENIAVEIEKLESPALIATIAANAQLTVTFEALKPAKINDAVSPLCARCKWHNNAIKVEHFINAQKHGEKGLRHKCYHLGNKCICKCKGTAFAENTYRDGNAVLGRITPGPQYGTPGLNWDGVGY